MSELWQLLKGLANLAYRYSTYRGTWRDMPDSDALCMILVVITGVLSAWHTYLAYGLGPAIALPVFLASALWLFATRGGGHAINVRLLSAGLLTLLPGLIALLLIGERHELVEVVLGVLVSMNILRLEKET